MNEGKTMRNRKTLVRVVGFLSILIGTIWICAMDAPRTARLNEIIQPQMVINQSPAIAGISPAWNVTWGGTDVDFGGCCAIDVAGENVYVVGYTKSFGAGDADALLIKFSIDGTKIWNITWGGSSWDEFSGILIDGDYIYVSGSTQSSGYVVSGATDAVFAKYDTDGNLQWYRIRGNTYNDMFGGIVMDSEGYLYIATYYTPYGGNSDMNLTKYDSNGNFIWAKQWGTTSNDDYGGVAIDPYTDDVYLSGSYKNVDAELVKYNSAGTQLWARTWGGSGADLQASCGVDSQGNVYLCGRCNSFGSYEDPFLAKYNSSGTSLWNRTWGGIVDECAVGVTPDPDDNIYISGRTGSYGAGGQDFFVLKYDPIGNQLWNITFGGSTDEYGGAICLDSQNNIFLTGETTSFGFGNDLVLAFIPNNNTFNTNPWNVTWGGSLDDSGCHSALDNTGEYVYVSGWTKSMGESNGDGLLLKYAINGTLMWSRTWGGPSYDEFGAVYVDTSGYIFVTGTTVSYTVGGAQDAVLLKYSPDGTQLWYRIWGGVYNDIFTNIDMDKEGCKWYIYLSTYHTTSGGNSDMSLVKYDTDGNLIWDRTWGGSGNDDIGTVSVDRSTHSIYLSGSYNNNYDASLLKYNSTGDLQWYRIWGGSGQDLQAECKVDSKGYVYLSGRTYSYGVNNVFVAKYDPTGNLLWSRTWGGTGEEEPAWLEIDRNDELCVGGSTSSYGVGGYDAFITKYDSDGKNLGNITWGGTGDEGCGAAIFDVFGNFFVPMSTSSWGAGSKDALLAYIPHIPSIEAPSTSIVYSMGTGNITWSILDWYVKNPTYSVYCEGSLWGSADLSWNSLVSFNTTISGLAEGDYNFTLIAQDGYGLSAQKTVTVSVVPHTPSITGPSSTSYGYGTSTHEISWTITDVGTSGATFTVYHNDSVFGTPDQGWVSGQVVTYNVGGFVMGDHNVTIVAQDGYGYMSQFMTLVSVSHQPIITGQSVANYTYDTSANELWWILNDDVTGTAPTYTIYHNGSTWGTPSQAWADDSNVSINVDGLLGGYHNFSICVDDNAGYSSWATTILAVHRAPIVSSTQNEITIYFDTANNAINWTALDNTTLAPRFTVYRNGSIWGSANQLWADGQTIQVNVDDLNVGYYNFTIGVRDGFGFNTLHQVLLSVFYLPTNGTWQDIAVGYQLLYCTENLADYAEFYLEGIATGGRIKISAFTVNPVSVSLEHAIGYYSIEVDGWNKVNYPVLGKFYYDPAKLAEGVAEDRLAVYHYENGQWVMLSSQVNVDSNYITANCPSFSYYAIAPASSSGSFDPEFLMWIIPIAVAIMVAYGCFKYRKGKSNAPKEEFPDLEFET